MYSNQVMERPLAIESSLCPILKPGFIVIGAENIRLYSEYLMDT